MAKIHVVEETQYVSAIARLYGLPVETVWHHPKNQALRERRKSAILFNGYQIAHVETPTTAPTHTTTSMCAIWLLNETRSGSDPALWGFHQAAVARRDWSHGNRNTDRIHAGAVDHYCLAVRVRRSSVARGWG